MFVTNLPCRPSLQIPTPALQASGLNMLSTQDAKKFCYSGSQEETLIDGILTSCVEEEGLGAGRNGVLKLGKVLEMERKTDQEWRVLSSSVTLGKFYSSLATHYVT